MSIVFACLLLLCLSRQQLLSYKLGADGSLRHLLKCDHGGYLYMNGKEIFRKAVAVVVESAQAAIAEAGLTPDEQRVVSACRRLGDCQGRGMGKPVRCPDDEGVEGVSAVETGLVCGVGSVGSGALGEIPRPTLVRTRQGFGSHPEMAGFLESTLEVRWCLWTHVPLKPS